MSKLRTCKACGGQVADNAYRCPHCGASTPLDVAMKALQFAGTLGVIFLIVYLFQGTG